MTSEQRVRVRDLFESALDRPTSERAAWIAREASDDVVVRDEVRSLLEHDSLAGSFLENPVLDRVPELLAGDVLQPGASVGAYKIVREIGRGGMGRVYMASDERLGRTVALKALAGHLLRDELQRERLRREARAAASLTHPGICTIYALEEIDGELYIAAEFIDGHTLREEMTRDRRPSAADVERVARELSSALSAAHDRGITHRDLKPENVMRAPDGRLKILDFGLARVDQSDSPGVQLPPAMATAPGMLIGTPAYMAPEQLNGESVDRRADVFALGVLLYEYACGVHPFEAQTPLATIARVLESDVRPLAVRCPHLPGTLARVIERCLRKAPNDRFQSAADVAAALDAPEPKSDRDLSTWWRVHQLVVCAMYIGAASYSWFLKEWIERPLTVSLFIAIGIGATIGCVLRGHMIFTEQMNRGGLAVEHRRTRTPLLILDVALAVAIAADAVLFIAWPLTSLMTLVLALGIALAAIVLEPATTRATFGDGLLD